jgi:hypothetical protein
MSIRHWPNGAVHYYSLSGKKAPGDPEPIDIQETEARFTIGWKVTTTSTATHSSTPTERRAASLRFSAIRQRKLLNHARSKISNMFVSVDNLFLSWSHD